MLRVRHLFLVLFLAFCFSPVHATAQSTSLLRVSGTIYEQGQPSLAPMMVTVINLSIPTVAPATVALGAVAPGKYSVLFFDPFEIQIMGKVGDQIEVRLTDSDTDELIQLAHHTILDTEITDGFGDVFIDIELKVARTLTFRPIEPQQVKPTQLLAFTLALTEPVDEVSFGLKNPPVGAQLTPETGVFAWVPDEHQIGDYQLEFTAKAGRRSGRLTVPVKVIPLFPTTTSLLIQGIAYDAPGIPTTRLVTIEVQNLDRPEVVGSAVIGETVPGRFSLLLFDPNNGSTMGSSGDVLEIRAVLEGNEELLRFQRALTDADIIEHQGTITLSLSLNRSPSMDPVEAQVVRVDQNFKFLLAASDPDDDPLLYAASLLPDGATLNAGTGAFSWVPSQAGEYTIQFTVTDGKQGADQQDVLFTVLPNGAPQFLPFGELPFPEARMPFELQLEATDPDGDAVTFLVTGAPAGAVLDPEGGQFTWVPELADVGQEFTLIFGAVDPYNALTTTTLQFTVLEPRFYGVELQALDPATQTIESYLGSATYALQATNVGNRTDLISLSAASEAALNVEVQPANAMLEAGATAIFEVSIQGDPATPAGEHLVHLTAASQGDPAEQAEAQVVVLTLDYPLLRVQPVTLQFDETTATQTIRIENEGGGTLRWELRSLPAWLQVEFLTGETTDVSEITLTAERPGLTPGEYADSFEVQNEDGQNAAVTVQLTVPEPRPATVKLLPSTQSVKVGARVTLHLLLESETEINLMEFAFAFDPSILQFVELSADSELLQWELGRIDNEIGQTTRPYKVTHRDGSAFVDFDLQLHFDVVGAGSTAISLLRVGLGAADGRSDFRLTKIPAKVDSIVPAPAWDINQDGITDIVDLVFVGQHFGESDPEAGDVNADGSVDILDLVILGAHFGERWETLAAPALLALSHLPLQWLIHPIDTGMVAELVAQIPISVAGLAVTLPGEMSLHVLTFGESWTSDSAPHRTLTGVNAAGEPFLAVARIDSGERSLQGALLRVELPERDPQFLEQALANVQLRLVDSNGRSIYWQSRPTLLPRRTELGANFPNPFNPETWIPFRLYREADVSVRIFDAQGQIVRTLALGTLPAGIYDTAQQAAYWDGRNQSGQRVASGVYYYQLRAGNETYSRRCVVSK